MAMWLLERMSKLLKTWPIDQIMLLPPGSGAGALLPLKTCG